MAYGRGADEVILLYSEELMEHPWKVGGNAFAEAQAHVRLGLAVMTRHGSLSLPGSSV
jgi:hypothetical protein